MNKILWIIGLLIFVFVTVFVVSLDSTQTRRVQFSNQEFAVTNESNDIVNSSNTAIKFSDSNITNKQITTGNSKIGLNSNKIDIKDSSSFESKSVKISDKSSYTDQNTQFSDYDFEYENQDVGFKNSDQIDYKNIDTSHLDAILADAKNVSTSPVDVSNKPFKQMYKDRYQYKKIDWSTWRSEFVNKILDDSMSIRSLDSYGYGAWFYYSFEVSKDGAISNILVKSMYLSEEDKKRVARLIKSYEYKDITIFPANSNRQSAKVSAVMMLSNETQRSKPSDFNDFEQIKMKF